MSAGMSAASLAAIPFDSLERLGIRGIVCDLDNTCIGRACELPAERESAWAFAGHSPCWARSPRKRS